MGARELPSAGLFLKSCIFELHGPKMCVCLRYEVNLLCLSAFVLGLTRAAEDRGEGFAASVFQYIQLSFLILGQIFDVTCWAGSFYGAFTD